MRFCILFALVISVAYCLPADLYKSEWEEFKAKYHKTYNTNEEEIQRFDIFSSNLDMIYEHNKKFQNNETTYTKAVTNFTDLTHDEFIEFLKEEGGLRSIQMFDSSNTYEVEWLNFKQKYHKTYSSKEEEEYRFLIFSNTLDVVREHNKQYEEGLSTYKMGINKFADLTAEEIREFLLVMASSENAYQQEWEDFKQKYHRTYPSQEEEQSRFQIFCKTLDKVTKHNELYEKGLSTYKMGINRFADLTAEERHKFLGTRTLIQDDYQKEFDEFKATYHKIYSSQEEEQYRFQIFSKTLDEVRRNNELYKKGLSPYVMGINKFADMTAEERRKYTMTSTSAFISILPKDVYQKEWENFKKTYQRLYESEQEEAMRYKIFCKNLDQITLHNKLYDMGLATSKMGVNQFSDYTAEEWNKMMGYKPSQ